jgi:hypothetical protein
VGYACFNTGVSAKLTMVSKCNEKEYQCDMEIIESVEKKERIGKRENQICKVGYCMVDA